MAKQKSLEELFEGESTRHLITTWLEKHGPKAKNVILIWIDENDIVRMGASNIDYDVVHLGMLAAATNLVFCGEVGDGETIEQDDDNVA